MPKQTVGQVNKKEGEKMQAFLEAYDKAVQPVTQEHKMKMIPVIQATEHGILPVFGVQPVITVDKKDEKSKTVKSTDTNDKGTKS